MVIALLLSHLYKENPSKQFNHYSYGIVDNLLYLSLCSGVAKFQFSPSPL